MAHACSHRRINAHKTQRWKHSQPHAHAHVCVHISNLQIMFRSADSHANSHTYAHTHTHSHFVALSSPSLSPTSNISIWVHRRTHNFKGLSAPRLAPSFSTRKYKTCTSTSNVPHTCKHSCVNASPAMSAHEHRQEHTLAPPLHALIVLRDGLTRRISARGTNLRKPCSCPLRNAAAQ